MRGRCSAGQKVLDSLIIRMVLAEAFLHFRVLTFVIRVPDTRPSHCGFCWSKLRVQIFRLFQKLKEFYGVRWRCNQATNESWIPLNLWIRRPNHRSNHFPKSANEKKVLNETFSHQRRRKRLSNWRFYSEISLNLFEYGLAGESNRRVFCEELLDAIDPDVPRSSDQFKRKPLIG